MSKKVLVADDSQTIQKVIKITFSNQDFELISALDEDSIYEHSTNFDLILLDFGLSEDGYELGKRVKEKFPNSPVLALLGTFDIVDDEQLKSSGYDDKVVKPFETEKFINLCNDMIISNPEPSTDVFESVEEESGEDEYEGWGVDTNSFTEEDSEDKTEEIELVSTESSLESELDGWGFDPTNLQGSDVTGDFDSMPPVIEAQDNSEASENAHVMNTLESIETKQESPQHYLDVSSLVGSLEDEEEIIFDDQGAGEEQEEAPVEVSEDNLWAVDEYTEEASFEETPSVQEENHVPTMEVSRSESSFDIEELKNDLRNDVAPIIEKYAREYCEQNIEKIIWEIVPDLAENIIKKELKNISKQVVTSISE